MRCDATSFIVTTVLLACLLQTYSPVLQSFPRRSQDTRTYDMSATTPTFHWPNMPIAVPKLSTSDGRSTVKKQMQKQTDTQTD